MKSPLYFIKKFQSTDFDTGSKQPYYFMLLFEGKGQVSVDFVKYSYSGKTVLFLTPYQCFQWIEGACETVQAVVFHGDFYCIEYHKKEVACNGLLFNNIYQYPLFNLSNSIYADIQGIITKMRDLDVEKHPYDQSILKSYLQLILALCSKEKQQVLVEVEDNGARLEGVTQFQALLEAHYLSAREVSFYANQFGLSVSAFSKKIKTHFGKTPSKLIQERIVLEAKKLLHLTHKPIKEIANLLNFEDEFYFSRYFKKEMGVSPSQFREEVGISIVAK